MEKTLIFKNGAVGECRGYQINFKNNGIYGLVDWLYDAHGWVMVVANEADKALTLVIDEGELDANDGDWVVLSNSNKVEVWTDDHFKENFSIV